jgi:hypothetical protein
MINVRKRIAQLFDQYSHNVVYIRRDTRFRCECFVERSGEPSPSCPKCFGTGNVVAIEPMRTRRQISSVPETLIGVNQLQAAGRLAPKAYVYYLEHDKKPQANDLILEVIWDTNGIPRYIKEKHLISAVEPKFGYKGRTEFYQVYARYDQKGANDDTALTEY